ncbi:hypothetical protein MCHI_003840 [Candidatus Magnetoovum chiemensis]|nr:hypothetical protein MCHI_003840 [Candidatus Magnetoovum chiemensis]
MILIIVIYLIISCNVEVTNAKVLSTRVLSIIDSLLGGAILAGLVFLSNNIVSKTFSTRDMVLTSYFNDIKECLIVLADSIERYELDKICKANITILSPFVFSKDCLKYIYDGKDASYKQECDSYLDRFKSKYDAIIKDKSGYDRSLYGKTNIPKMDNETYDFIVKNYFRNDFSSTTELGFHPNLNESATFILGKNSESNNPSETPIVYFILQIYFTSDYKTVYGYVCENRDTASKLYQFTRFKINEAIDNNNYIIHDGKKAPDQTTIDAFKDKVNGFYGKATTV